MFLAVLAILSLTACISAVDTPVLPPVRLAAEPPAASRASGLALAAPMRRLTRDQYQRSVIDLFAPLKWTETPAAHFPADETAGPFSSNWQSPMSALQVELAVSAAEELGARAAGQLSVLLADCAKPDAACATKYLDALARRAWRRPVSELEAQQLRAVFAAGGGDVARGLRLGITAILAAPSFLYLVDTGTMSANGQLVLTDDAVAARLSYFLWNTTPDEALIAAANSGALSTADGVAQQAWRMLRDDRSTPQLGRFHLEWLGLGDLDSLEKDAKRYPFFTAAARASFKAETIQFVDAVVRRSDGRLQTLLAAPFSAPGEASLAVYGVDGAVNGIVGLDPVQRAGILTQPAFLAAHSNPKTTSPTHRGHFIVTQLLCLPLGAPPPGVNLAGSGVDVSGAHSRRAVVEEHARNPSCAGCHQLMDPIGLSFEHYDAVGAWRDTDLDDHQAVDSKVTITTGTDIDGDAQGAVELIGRLAHSREVRSCAVLQWYRFALGRPETGADGPELSQLQQRFEASGGSIPDLLVAIVTSDAFRTRAP